jgi:hypothetical protein
MVKPRLTPAPELLAEPGGAMYEIAELGWKGR